MKPRDPIIHNLAYLSDLAPTEVGTFITPANSLAQNLAALDRAVATVPEQADYSVTCTETTPEGYAKTYTFTQRGETIATVNIPKDMVVSSGAVVDKAEAGSWGPAGKYIELTLANSGSSKVYIPVTDLVDVYTVEQNAPQVQLAIGNGNEISASIVAGSIGTNELSEAVNADLALARNALQEHQDITGKADKVANTSGGNFAALDASGNLVDSGKKASDFVSAEDLTNTINALDSQKTSSDGVNIEVQVTENDGKITRVNITRDDTYAKPEGGIPTSDIADGAVTNAKLDPSVADAISGALKESDLDETTIERDATNGVQVKDGAITTSKLANLASFNLIDCETGDVYTVRMANGRLEIVGAE